MVSDSQSGDGVWVIRLMNEGVCDGSYFCANVVQGDPRIVDGLYAGRASGAWVAGTWRRKVVEFELVDDDRDSVDDHCCSRLVSEGCEVSVGDEVGNTEERDCGRL